MAQSIITSSAILLLVIAEGSPQFYDFFNYQPVQQYASTRQINNEYSTRRTTKIETIRTFDDPQITWKNTTVSFSYDGIERDDNRQTTKPKRRKQNGPTLAPIFGFFTTSTTQKPARKSNKVNNSSRRNNATSPSNSRTKATTKRSDAVSNTKLTGTRVSEDSPNRHQFSYDVDVKDHLNNGYFDKPMNYIADDYYTRPHYEITTRPSRYNNDNNYFTTKNPFINRPGVKPAVPEIGPAITNKPVTKRPSYYKPELYRPETERPNYRPETERPNYRPETEKPVYRPQTNRPAVTVRPYIVNPIPTDPGAVVYPHEDEPPQVIRGPDEDYMSEAEKRRYIDIAEKMCDKYKSLSTTQLQAIPLLPSPEPVQVNVSQCTPTTIPLVVGGKVVSINEFPHMALLGWVKIDGGGYSWKCGGSLISDQYVLTASHCSYQERDNTVVSGPPRVVQLGSSYLDDPGALVVRVAAVVRHPKYKFPKSYYDVALLKLVQPITFSEVIRPACLGVPPAVDEPVIATGWGKTEHGGDQSLELRSVSLPVWEMRKCHEILGTSRKMPQGVSAESQLCAGETKGGKDTCQGDSGGPAQIQDGCAWRVVAVTSLGRSCGAPNTPGLYALVHRAFIAAQVFGSGNKNQNRRDNAQTTKNYNNNNRRIETTTQPYNNSYNSQQNYGGNRQENSETNKQQNYNNNNRRVETTTQPYNNNYNSQQNYGGNRQENSETNKQQNNNNNNNRRIETTTQLYNNNYNSQENYGGNNRQGNDYANHQRNNRRTDETYDNDYDDQNSGYHQNENQNSYNNRKPNDYSNQQQSEGNSNRESYSNINNRQQGDSSNNNRYENDYSNNNRQNSSYYSNNNQQNGFSVNNRQQNNRGNDGNRFEDGRIWWT